MQPEHRRPAAATRLRLVSLHTPAGSLQIGGDHACVHTADRSHADVAETIAHAVIGPRPPGVSGTIEIAGRFVALETLPAPLLPPTAAATIDEAILDELSARVRARQRAEKMAAHATRRLERLQTAAAIERARVRAEEVRPRPAVEPEPVVDDVTPRLEALLAALHDLQPVPSTEACALADIFEHLASPPETGREVDIDLTIAAHRVQAARVALATSSGGVLPDARAKIEVAHRAVVDSERVLFEAGRKEKAAALARYQDALTAERVALADAGVDSYAALLVMIAAGGAPVDAEARLRAELDLAEAEAALAKVRGASEAAAADHRARTERELELRAQAAHLLGRFPGADPASELRALRVDHPDAAALHDALASTLASVGAPTAGDLVEIARDVIRSRHDTTSSTSVPAPADAADALHGLRAEAEALLRQLAAHDRALEAIDDELDELDRVPTSFAALDRAHATTVVEALIDAYRAADVLAGRFPLVLDGPFDALAPDVVDALAHAVTAPDDIQTIVVTANAEVARAFAVAGAVTTVWSAPAEEVRVPGPSTLPPMCELHAASVSASGCAHCGRPSCLDCLVYVPGETDLWCVGCAEALRARNLRLLRRRGA